MIPQGSRGAKGRPLVNMLPLESAERITAVLPIKDFTEDKFVFMATRNGTVKKTPLEQFSRPRTAGLIALELEDDNQLVGAALTHGTSDVLLMASSGKAVRFKESDVRAMGRSARGVRGIRLLKDQTLIALIIPQDNGFILTASERGYGKRTPTADFPVKGRGILGVIAQAVTRRNGDVIGATQVFDGDEVMLISNQGTLVRTAADGISQLGRNTQGVKLINLRDDETLVGLQRIDESEDEPEPGSEPTSEVVTDSQRPSDTENPSRDD